MQPIKSLSTTAYFLCANHCVCPFTVKEDCVSDGEDDVSTDALVEEMLQQGDTAVIYPEAPEDEHQRQGTPDASVHDENGTGQHHGAFTAHSCHTKKTSCSFYIHCLNVINIFTSSTQGEFSVTLSRTH